MKLELKGLCNQFVRSYIKSDKFVQYDENKFNNVNEYFDLIKLNLAEFLKNLNMNAIYLVNKKLDGYNIDNIFREYSKKLNDLDQKGFYCLYNYYMDSSLAMQSKMKKEKNFDKLLNNFIEKTLLDFFDDELNIIHGSKFKKFAKRTKIKFDNWNRIDNKI